MKIAIIMKNIKRKINISLTVLVFVVPVFAYADTYDDSYYGGYANTYDDSYYGGYANTYDDSYYGGYANTYDDSYYGGYANTYDEYNSGIQNSSPAQSIYNAPDIYQSQIPQITYYNDGGDYWEPNYSYDGYDGYNYQNYYGGGCTSNCGNSGRDTIVIRDRIIRDYDDDDDDDDDDNDYDYDNLEVVCRVSDTYIEEGDKVTFTAEVNGGNSPYRYSWRGDASGNDRKITKTFRKSGTYEVTIRVTDDDGRTATDECTVRVEDERNYSVNYFDYPTDGSASVDSVFLNQVPYTGPADTAKGIGFVGLVLAWSFAIAYAIRKKMNRNETVKRIEEFKNLNKQTQTIN